MKLVLQLLTYNDSEYLPHCLTSLQSQTDKNWELWTRDQSTEESHKENVRTAWEGINLGYYIHREAGENLGFAGGHQKLFAAHDAELVLLVNVDTILAEDFIEKVRAEFVLDHKIAAATGTIYRWTLDGENKVLSNDLDSIGLVRKRTEKFEDVRERPKNGEVLNTFGVSGCLPMYRRSALEATDPEGRLFDPAYHSYKEDIDVAYRLNAGGWKHCILPDAVAYHHRSFKPGIRPKASSWSQRQSYRNHIWNLITHLSSRDWITRGWMIIPYELAKTGYLFAQSPKDVVRAWTETLQYLPELRARKKTLQEKYAN